ncbi:cytochrome-c peroxidase [Magnetospirillum sp. UT-4]|uniref:cytochrome-c peroxidase n=1 Tax=Magnetospirillum sp. UT-4 TaxID=2681467 RepID=UPI001380EBEC|nr:cytochrome c peroxidase [Magnetospirillum sp. UT-4]CAA7625161.1 putative Cytochrome c peroxidase family protein [Magnetospirillum sp. UT-4]
MTHKRRPPGRLLLSLAALGGLALANAALAQPIFQLPAPPSLKGVTPPAPDLTAYVKDDQALLILGKALFWDQAIGSHDVACASCHFHAGADSRVKNQLSPGILDRSKPEYDPDGDTSFGDAAGKMPSGAMAGPNYRLKRDDFPMFQLVDEANRDSAIKFQSNDVVSSQGAFFGQYIGQYPQTRTPLDACSSADFDPIYHVGMRNVRRVEPRHTPTTINAVYYRRNFWDGRASNFFNGATPFGERDGAALLAKYSGGWEQTKVAIPNLSLASQAVGPIVSELEMICRGRSLAEFGRKVLARQPLARQKVHPGDSVLGKVYSRKTLGQGITGTYADWVKRAFKPEWWQGGVEPAGMPAPGYSQMEGNFSLFWGIAVARYQASLISDDSKYDRAKASPATATLSAEETRGLDLFRSSQTGCIFCHNGPLFSNATFPAGPAGKWLDRVPGASGKVHLIDEGFFNIGTRPTDEDLGVGGTDPFGKPLSLARQYMAKHTTTTADDALIADPTLVDAIDGCTMLARFNTDAATKCAPTQAQIAAEEVAVDGAFKSPMLRNVELTGPYFHYGQYASLDEVLTFYRRGGDRRVVNQPGDIRVDTTGKAPNPTNLSGAIVPLNITDADAKAIVAFLKTLTDDRVRCEQGPFDHPALRVAHGVEGDQHAVYDTNHDGKIDEEYVELPAVGATGLPGLGKACLGTFEDKLTQN